MGVDLHRRRSVIVVLDGDGTELWTTRIDSDPLSLGLEIEKAGPAPEVVTRSGAWLRPRLRDWRTRSDDCELEIGMAPNRWRGRLM
jgi:hypothetical protein